MISIETINSRKQLIAIRNRWDNLIEKCQCFTPYLTFEWYHTALETIDKDKEPYLIFFKQNGEDICLAPFVLKRQKHFGFRFYTIGFVQNPYTPYQAIIYTKDFEKILEELMAYLHKQLGKRFLLDLDEMRLNSCELNAIDRLFNNRVLLYRKENKAGSRYLPLQPDFQATLKALKKKAQKEFRRKLKRIGNLGPVGLLLINKDKEVDSHLDEFFRMYRKTWKGEEPFQEFYYKLCKLFAKEGLLYFYALTIDQKAIAYLIALRGNDIIYGIKTTYDPSYYSFSPGIVLFYKCIEDMHKVSGVREFDIGRGNEQFKREWTSLWHPHTRLLIYPNTVFWQISNRIRYDMLPRMKKHRSFEIFYSALRSQWLHGDNRRINGSSETRKIVKKRITIEDYIGPVTDRYLVRYAKPGDLDHLAVAMSALNFRQVQQRIDKQRCILILRGNRILAYFWLVSHGETECENGTNSEEVFIDNYGISEDLPSEDLEKEFIPIMLKFMGHEKPDIKAVVLASSPSQLSA